MRARPGAAGAERISRSELTEEASVAAPRVAPLAFAACLAYSPSGTGGACDEGRAVRAQLKSADPRFLAHAAALVWQAYRAHGRFGAFFGPGVLLVPVPGSRPAEHGAWVGERLACCLAQLGLGSAVWPVLLRRRAVRKSAFAPSGQRPSVLEHHASFGIDAAVMGGLGPGCSRARLLLVDDVVTRGRTLLGAAARLREVMPGLEVRGFALLRTLDREQRLECILDPCEGEVRWLAGDARRIP